MVLVCINRIMTNQYHTLASKDRSIVGGAVKYLMSLKQSRQVDLDSSDSPIVKKYVRVPADEEGKDMIRVHIERGGREAFFVFAVGNRSRKPNHISWEPDEPVEIVIHSNNEDKKASNPKRERKRRNGSDLYRGLAQRIIDGDDKNKLGY